MYPQCCVVFTDHLNVSGLVSGPTGPQMQELSQMTYSGENYHEVMSMLWKRMLIDNKANWRRVYKVEIRSLNGNLHCYVQIFGLCRVSYCWVIF